MSTQGPSANTTAEPTGTVETLTVDVLIVGAGISGVGGGYHLSKQCPDKTFLILESQDDFGGTWRTHTYPGIRSDSDLYTFGYRFKPWVGAPIASGEEILKYMGEVIEENDLARHIRYRHTVDKARWSTEDKRWQLQVTKTDAEGAQHPVEITTNFLWMCQGYYRHSEGYTPDWPDMDRFQGTIVHPQRWPDNLDYENKNVVVIGSGATAATLIPAMADKVDHITMLQRSPTYFFAGRNHDELADTLRELDIPDEWTHEIVRRKVLKEQDEITRLSFEEPERLTELLYAGIREYMGEDYELAPHFTPAYRPWRQRLAKVPDGDLFTAMAEGKASVATDTIEKFTETGIQLASGDHLDADIIVTATGFNLSVLGDIDFVVDGEPLVFADTVSYRGAMFTGVPNMLWVFGYFRASWTLRADLLADFVCRLLNHMDDIGAEMVVPTLRPEDADMERRPWVDPENFNPGYLMRGMHLMPSQGDRDPWLHQQDYMVESKELPEVDLSEPALAYR